MKNTVLFKSTVLLLAMLFITSCKTSSVAKSELKAKNKVVLDSLMAQKEYRVDIEVIYPFNTVATTQVANALLMNTGNTANRIDVRGDGNFIEIKNDSVKAYLPFFGESRISGGGYNGTNIAIEIEEPLSNLKKNIDNKKGTIELSFNASQKEGDNDKYEIKINIFANKGVSVDVMPVYRTFIRYDGTLAENKE